MERMARQPSVILTGFMGTGKTTLGSLLAKKINAHFIDSDSLIEDRSGRPIAEIFASDGEPFFRALERGIAREYSGKPGFVMSTGGGLMVDPLNAVLLGRNNVVFCLTSSPEELLARLKDDKTERPLLEGPNPDSRLRELLETRREAYGLFIQIDTSGREPDHIVEEMAQTFRQIAKSGVWRNPPVSRLDVAYPDGAYPVMVGSGILDSLAEMLDHGSSPIIITDDNVGPLYAHQLAYLNPDGVIKVAAGEAYKTLDSIRGIYDTLLECGADRTTPIIALGGGVIGDMAGFAAATYMRGTPFLQCPTTVLAMVDASVGGKTGVDLPQGKNLVGAFKQPLAVVADVDTLWTLAPDDFNAGLAEIVKHGLIASPGLLARLESEPDLMEVYRAGQAGEPAAAGEILPVIVEAILIKRDVVQADPYETGRRKILNLGHTFAHAIEQVSDYRVRHGHAVAIGLVAAIRLSAHLGHGEDRLATRIERLLGKLQLPTRLPAGLKPVDIIQAMISDKKKVQGRLNFVLIRDVADVFVSGQVPEATVLATLQSLQSEE